MRCKCVLMLGLLIGLPAVSRGAVYTFAFEGSVDTVANWTSWTINIHPGDRAIFTYTFDSDASHNPPPYVGSYSGISSSLQIGDTVFSSEPFPQLSVQMAYPQLGVPARFSVTSYVSAFQTSGWTDFSLSTNDSVFPDDSLPVTPPDLSWFPQNYFQVLMRGPTSNIDIGISGTIDSSYAIPEPLSAMLLSIGGLVMGSLRRTRRQCL